MSKKKADEPNDEPLIYLSWATKKEIADELAKRDIPFILIWGDKENHFELDSDLISSSKINYRLAHVLATLSNYIKIHFDDELKE